MRHAVQIERGHLQPFCHAASQHQIAVIVGCIERAQDRGGHSLYCSLVYKEKGHPIVIEDSTCSKGDGHGSIRNCAFRIGGALHPGS
jgi:nitrilase